MTSLATAVGGMKHWDWCPICRGGLDTGLECDQCGADIMPIYKAFKDLQARPTDSAVLRGIKARAARSRLGYGGKAWVTSDPKSEVVEDRMILIEIVGRQEFAINRLLAALNEAADSFKNVGLSVDAEDCERVIEESLLGRHAENSLSDPQGMTPAVRELARYADHTFSCAMAERGYFDEDGNPVDCTCGYTQAIEAVLKDQP